MLEVSDISFSYNQKCILNNLNFVLKKGEIGALIGASGSGKTTIFKLLTGLITPQYGAVHIAGLQMPEAQSQVAYMMQEDLLLPWRTVFNNLLLIGELGRNRQSMRVLEKEALSLLHEVGLSGCENLYPDQLSGGMRQRVSLARALLLKRPLLLLDEPFDSLDVSLREQMYSLVREIQSYHQTTILMITHDFREALSLADRIYLLDEKYIKQEWHILPSLRTPAKLTHFHEEMRAAIMK